MKSLDLFAGIGGFALGLHRAGIGTSAFVETDHFCKAVLAKNFPETPCYDDVRTVDADRLRRDGISCEIISAGFPCQDISIAGSGAGLAGERSGLFFEVARLIRELRPRFAIMENVAALLHRGLPDVLAELASIRYDAEWHGIPSAAVGAPHQRDRIFVIAYPYGTRLEGRLGPILSQRTFERLARTSRSHWFDGRGIAQSGVRRVANGIPARVDRIKSLGNSVVPQITEIIGRAIIEAEQRR